MDAPQDHLPEFVTWVRSLTLARVTNLVIDAYWKNQLTDTELVRQFLLSKSGFELSAPTSDPAPWTLAQLHAYIAEEADLQCYASLSMKPDLTRALTNHYVLALRDGPDFPRHVLESNALQAYRQAHAAKCGTATGIHSYGSGLLLSLILSLVGQLLYAWILNWWRTNHPTSDWNVQATSTISFLNSLASDAIQELHA